MIYPLLEFGSGVYATDTGGSGGVRYISEIEGLENYQVSDNIGSIRALDGTIYSQLQAVKDVLVTITFPLIDTTKYGAIKTVIQTAITGATTFTLNITSDMGNFTFTAKPAENAVSIEQSILSGKVVNFRIRAYCTD